MMTFEIAIIETGIGVGWLWIFFFIIISFFHVSLGLLVG